MKRTALFLSSILISIVFLSSCVEDILDSSYDESLIVGTWKSGTLHETYNANKTGSTWDTSDDVTEAEAQTFTWSISKDQLEQIHIMEISGTKIPKVYTLTNLTATTLSYQDDYGVKKTFTKQ